MQFFFCVSNRLNPVVEKIYLPSAIDLVSHGFADDTRAVWEHGGGDRGASRGRGVNARDVPEACQRQGERARNGGCRERENVYLGAHFLEAFFLPHAEALFLVNDYESEIFELQV